MGSCLSCPEKESVPDNHQSKFKVVNVDDDGNELGSGVMELTEAELVLHTHRRDDVRWPYLCLRRYGYDSNLFSFESGRRCQTGQGIFAFKCPRAEEIFNMLQEVMHSHSISVVEEAVMEPQGGAPPTALGYSVPSVPNGVGRAPSVGEASHPSTRHPSVASTRLPSVGEESTHPLLVAEDAVHTYVNTTGLLEEQPSPMTATTPLESPGSPPAPCPPTPPPPPPPRAPPEPAVLLEAACVRFVLGPTPVQRQLMERQQQLELNGAAEPAPPPPHANGAAPRRQRPPPLTPDLQNANNSAQRRTALLDYENLPALPPVWEARKPSGEEEEPTAPPPLNGHAPHGHAPHGHAPPSAPPHMLEHSHNYVNTENVTAPLSARLDGAQRPDAARRRADGPTVFNFDFRRPAPGADPPKTLNYIEVEMEGVRGASDGSGPHTPRTPGSPPPPSTPTRRAEPYALIDIERTAAMSSLQKARPRDDGTARKTRHNSTELPTKSTA